MKDFIFSVGFGAILLGTAMAACFETGKAWQRHRDAALLQQQDAVIRNLKAAPINFRRVPDGEPLLANHWYSLRGDGTNTVTYDLEWKGGEK